MFAFGKGWCGWSKVTELGITQVNKPKLEAIINGIIEPTLMFFYPHLD